MLQQATKLFCSLQPPRHPKYAGSVTASSQGRQKLISRVAPLKVVTWYAHSTLLPTPTPKEKLWVGYFVLIMLTWANLSVALPQTGCVCGTPQRAAELSLTLHGLQQLKVCRLPVSGQSQEGQIAVPQVAPPKVRTLGTFQSFPPKGDTSSWTFPPNPLKPGQLKGGATVVDMKWLSYPFWYGYAWLWVCQGYCDFVIDFWSPIKSLWVIH